MKIWVLVCKTFDPDNAGVIDVFATREAALAEMKRCYEEEAEDDDDADFERDLRVYTGTADEACITYTTADDEDFTWEMTSHVVTEN